MQVYNRRQRFYELHEKLAHNYESMAMSTDIKYGMPNIRKSILKFAEGVRYCR
jgi:hypothetical protein